MQSEPAVKPTDAVQSQRVIAKEAEVEELTLLLDEVILGPVAYSHHFNSLSHCVNSLCHIFKEFHVGLCRLRQGWRPPDGSSV
jgi:hypothetical protein